MGVDALALFWGLQCIGFYQYSGHTVERFRSNTVWLTYSTQWPDMSIRQIPSTLASTPLLRSGGRTLAQQLAERVGARIRDHLLAPGARLPSVRQCAVQQGLSPSTVVSAYDLLLAQGLVVAQRGRGYFVRGTTSTLLRSAAPRVGTQGAERMTPPLNAAALIRSMFQPLGSRGQPGMGVLPHGWLDTPFLGVALRRVSQVPPQTGSALSYGEPMGDLSLRHALSSRLHHMGLPAAVDQIVTTIGATQALDIVSRTLLRPGDGVMVEEPGWAVEFARLEALGMRVFPVPRGAHGPDLAIMAQLCQAHSPKLYVSVSTLHNPTGACLTPASAHRVLQLAQQHDFFVVEDDTYSHLAPEHATRMSVLDGLQRTIYVSGFAKILAPNWRVGYLAAPVEWVERLLDTKLLSTLTTPSLLERALAVCIEQGQLRRHAQRIRQRLDEARGRSVRLATTHGCQLMADPAGLFGWVDAGVDTELLAQRLLDHDILIAPGALFHAVRTPSRLMRINFATTQDAAFWSIFARCRDEVLKGGETSGG
jgi:DNA-binding transcriptional MocR family regulator